MSCIKVFWSNHETEMPKDIVLRLDRENKMLRNAKIAQKTRETKMRKNSIYIYKLKNITDLCKVP